MKTLTSLLSKCLLFVSLCGTSFASYAVTSETETFTVDNIVYTKQNPTTIVGLVNRDITYVAIPDTVVFDSITYTVDTLGAYAFRGCNRLRHLTIPQTIVAIKDSSVWSPIVKMRGDAVPATEGVPFVDPDLIYVPSAKAQIYQSAWANYRARMQADSIIADYDIEVHALPDTTQNIIISDDAADKKSQVKLAIGEANIPNVRVLKVKGEIDSYDLIIIRNKMRDRLEVLDLSECTTVDCNYPLYNNIVVTEANKIPSYAFSEMLDNLRKISFSDSIVEIGDHAFWQLDKLKEVYLPKNMTKIGNEAFKSCVSLEEITFPDTLVAHLTSLPYGLFFGCSRLKHLQHLPHLTTIESYCLFGCSSLESFQFNEGLTQISTYAFYRCSSLKELSFPATLTDISNHAFDYCTNVEKVIFEDGEEDLNLGIGSDTCSTCRKLYLTLHSSNIKEAYIGRNIAYAGNREETSDIAPFHDCKTLEKATIGPKVRYIGHSFFNGCTKLEEITIPANIDTIYSKAFQSCSNLQSIIIEDSEKELTTKGNTFASLAGLKEVYVGRDLSSSYEFAFNSNLQKARFGNKVTIIRNSTLYSCSNLKVLFIPSSVLKIEENAFAQCNGIDSVTVTTILPMPIMQNTFSRVTNDKATLYVPGKSIHIYYLQPEWGRFKNIKGLDASDIDIDYAYIDRDFELDMDSVFGGNPNIDILETGGLIVDEEGKQDVGILSIFGNSETSGSVIVYGSLTPDTLVMKLNYDKNKGWYFLSFPYDMARGNIDAPGSFSIYSYDGAIRASQGGGSWHDENETDTLRRGVGYIFKCSTSGTVNFVINTSDMLTEDFTLALQSHEATDQNDAHWNFVGNPYTAYYPIHEMGVTSPITVWNSQTRSYNAYRALDDNFSMKPMQSFFLQKPVSKEKLTFDAQKCLTYRMSLEYSLHAPARAFAEDNSRQLVNLQIEGNGSNDKTRIVFNNEAAMYYELECDASKFFSDEAEVQLFSQHEGIDYAINERPVENGEVGIGYITKQSGSFTISLDNSDAEVALFDNQTGTEINLNANSYTFYSEAGRFDDRLLLIRGENATGVNNLGSSNGSEGEVFDLLGIRQSDDQPGTHIVKKGNSVHKIIIRK